MVEKKKASPSSASKQQPKKRRRVQASSPKSKKAPVPVVEPAKTLIIDNGGDSLKYGWSTDENPRILPNVTARLKHQFTVLVGDELKKVQNPNSLMALTRSTERGMICNLGNQTQVWKRMLDILGVVVPSTSEAADTFGWKTSRKIDSNLPKIPSHTIAVMILLPPNCPRLLLDQIMYVWMEDFGVSRVGFGISSAFAAKEHPVYKCACTIDMGWSSTLVVPTFKQKPVQASSIRRCPIGGRHMINMLKYYMSYRQYNLMDQEKILREVFERLSYISLTFKDELKLARYKPSGRRPYDRDFILPDYQTSHEGEIRIPLALQREIQDQNKEESNDQEEDDNESSDEDFDEGESAGGENDDDQGAEYVEEDDEEEETHEEKRRRLLRERAEQERLRREQEQEEQILRVSVERFTIPEVLFSPQDAGLPSDLVGVAQAVVQAIDSCPKAFHPALYQSIYITGGVSQLANFNSRLEEELRTLVNPDYSLKIEMSDSPTSQAWIGARLWINQKSSMMQWSVGREEWGTSSSKRKVYSRLLVSNGGCYT